MRLFVGVELGAGARAEAAAACTELRRRVDTRAPRARITWVAPERLHLTVRFIGETADPLAARIIAAFREPLPFPSFACSFDRFGTFPAAGPPRVIWIGIDAGRDAIGRVEAAVGDRLAALGVPREDRGYRPHLTLARVREAAGLRPAGLFDGLTPPAAETLVEAITLFRSQLSPQGPTYTAVEKVWLAGG